MSISAYVLQEIAGQDDRGGARVSTIRTMVDGRQKLLLTDEELTGALSELVRRGHIRQDGDTFSLSDSTRAIVTRTRSGTISMEHKVWSDLSEQLGFGL